MKRVLSTVLFVVSLVLLISSTGAAQSQDRGQLLKRIDKLRAELQASEKAFLSASPEDYAENAEFLRQPDTGLTRLLPREKFQKQFSIREGGAYFSFTRLTHEYGYGSDISLERDNFGVGFAGADFGFLTNLGNVPLESISLDYPGAQFLADFEAPALEAEARAHYR
ncbi:MAG TPA: hypothetical protein VG778_10345, partial [Blastocatellia bacterium]|nr:hypothetical protein [Blastocatellia bacterium]